MASSHNRVIELERKLARAEAINSIENKERIVDSICDAAKTFIKISGYCVIAFFCYKSIAELAGKVTIADIKAIFGFSVNDGTKTASKVSWGLMFNFVMFGIAGLAIRYGLRQRKLLGDSIEQIQMHKRLLEERLDPNRSSSLLTRRGDTNSDDL